MILNTAVFYDVENLLHGHCFSPPLMPTLSFREILQGIHSLEQTYEILLQRAYAHWNEPRLGMLRGELTELEIEAIEIIGFSRDAKKNAADIQLAIDVMESVHLRPWINACVIVSGDGGFGALARKLRERGKWVVGCARPQSASRAFRAACDEFLELGELQVKLTGPAENVPSLSSTESVQITNKRVNRLAESLLPLKSTSLKKTWEKVREVLHWFQQDSESVQDLQQRGIFLSVIREALNYAIPEFQPLKLGFTKFTELMQFACAGTSLCIVRLSPNEVRLISRGSASGQGGVLPDLDLPELHCAESYRIILGTGSPLFRLPTSADLHQILDLLLSDPPSRCDLSTLMENVASALVRSVSPDAVKWALLTLVSAGVFLREPVGGLLSNQKLSLMEELQTAGDIILRIQEGMRRKLTQYLDTPNEAVLQQVLPAIP